ncbi:E3 ubiquitin-protein ligase TRIM48-like [Eptesicus fuscus]|uniref:E3 ubiquitin-protein ligase TRIM48-like n=1 Tax=Eptesicus fuscus TaxID=29078 RepID=UPI0024045281|nr:E3 ubiquitin-protein ligase TRIM48-like [Eptesicus fuscus]
MGTPQPSSLTHTEPDSVNSQSALVPLGTLTQDRQRYPPTAVVAQQQGKEDGQRRGTVQWQGANSSLSIQRPFLLCSARRSSNSKNMDGILQVFQNELICSICRNYFIDPITIECGHSFCRPCFYLSLPNRSVLAHCSECQKAIQQRDFHTNVCLKQMVLTVRQASLWHFLHSKDNRCRIHMEAKQIFCEDQRSLLCLHCSTSQEHEAHRHCSVEEAAEQHREKLLKTMRSLWEKCCENDRKLNVETVTICSWEIYLLLDFGDILHRSEAVCVHMPQPVKAELTAVTIPGMLASLAPMEFT